MERINCIAHHTFLEHLDSSHWRQHIYCHSSRLYHRQWHGMIVQGFLCNSQGPYQLQYMFELRNIDYYSECNLASSLQLTNTANFFYVRTAVFPYVTWKITCTALIRSCTKIDKAFSFSSSWFIAALLHANVLTSHWIYKKYLELVLRYLWSHYSEGS